MNEPANRAGGNDFLKERIRYLEETNRTYVAILDMLASSDDFQSELNQGKSMAAIFRATLAQVKRLLPFKGMGILVNREDSSFELAVSDPSICRNELQADIDTLITEGTFAWALNRNQPIIIPAADGNRSLLLHMIATQSRIRGMFIGRLPDGRKTIDSPSLNALTITMSTTAHALESHTLYTMLRSSLRDLERMVDERTAELSAARNLAEKTAKELKKSNENLIALSYTDPLTRLYNRRFLMADLEKEMKRAQSRNESLSLLIMDIDQFKRINDTYGHQCGDMVLVVIADISQHRMRSHDVVARYGGEEFVIVLPETSLHDAVSVAERLRESVLETGFPPPMDGLTISVSIGIATYPSPMVDNIDSLFRLADEALYRAKRNGGNRVEVMNASKKHPSNKEG